MFETALETLHAQQGEHLAHLQRRYATLLETYGFDAVLLYSGHATAHYADDQFPAFQTFGHFMHWMPMADIQHSWLLIQPGRNPQLYLHAPADFWHLPTSLPDEPWVAAFDVTLSPEPLLPTLPGGRMAMLGDAAALAQAPDAKPDIKPNPDALLKALDELRMHKSAYEISCLRSANRMALAGHQAAREAFSQGAGELDIQLAYLGASRQRESAVPYQNIIGTNHHAGVLHYQRYDLNAPSKRHSLLVDAGYRYRGYCADITRTQAGPDAPAAFGKLIDAMQRLQTQLIESVRPGVNFVDLHRQMHRGLGEVLQSQGLIHCSAEDAVTHGITRAFCPHGLGHSLGLQVHDVAGLRHPDGTPNPPPAAHPALRLTRELTPGMVVTIEPGLYFIPMLLEPLRSAEAGKMIDWQRVDTLTPCGGIRIEDNITVTDAGFDNLTVP
ncbi:Xaa-Pro dipeptidase [Vreelandella rituensis]|uniref:Xaa-Pro dipeptidase n=1 Tax=Vreelandella rituensis TaxID=2282306 RepID=A0A368TW39_9GAMM|nr:Xaa-Pro dipeptidase [Halomonas rituensis]RCV88801.1 Xaa-Pro dipeptidase [Halomonas rituensis]